MAIGLNLEGDLLHPEKGIKNENIYWSDDGVNWTFAEGAPKIASERIGTSSIASGGLAYGDKWVLVGGGTEGKNIYYSADGIHWTAAAGEPFRNGVGAGVAYGNGRWVAVGNGLDSSGNSDEQNVYYSDDGIHWTAVPGLFSVAGQAVAYGNGRFVAGGCGFGKNIYWSDDGIHWTAAPGEPFGNSEIVGDYYASTCLSVAYGNRWVAVGVGSGNAAGKNLYYSDDGIHWTAVDGFSKLSCVAYGDGKWIIVGERGVGYSYDGITWLYPGGSTLEQRLEYGFKCGPLLGVSTGIAYGNRWVVVGSGLDFTTFLPSGKNIWYSV